MSEVLKHTAGPWTWRETMTPGSVLGREHFVNVRLGNGELRVLGADAVTTADAALIAAAPDLLIACELWDQGFTDGEEFTPEQLLAWVNKNRAAARAAIAKAKAPVPA